jgi:hypothetical protein
MSRDKESIRAEEKMLAGWSDAFDIIHEIEGDEMTMQPTPTTPPLPVEQDDIAPGGDGFVPCPFCHQYSYSINDDKLAEAFRHFQSMQMNELKGYPTHYTFSEETRDHAQVLMAAARLASQPDVRLLEECIERVRSKKKEYPQQDGYGAGGRSACASLIKQFSNMAKAALASQPEPQEAANGFQESALRQARYRLENARDWFADYERQHREKAPPAHDKAEANYRRKTECAEGIAEIDTALSSQPEQGAAAGEIIERCAKVAEEYGVDRVPKSHRVERAWGRGIAAAIRALSPPPSAEKGDE